MASCAWLWPGLRESLALPITSLAQLTLHPWRQVKLALQSPELVGALVVPLMPVVRMGCPESAFRAELDALIERPAQTVLALPQ